MKIKYLMKPAIDEYPPCVSQIRIIKDLGYDIEVWYGRSGKATLDLLAESGAKLRRFDFAPDSEISKIGKVKNWIQYRRTVLKAMKECDAPDVVFWFGVAESAIPLFPLSGKFRMVMSVLEFMDTRGFSRRLSASIARKCTAVTACESNRALLMKFWWKLGSVPYVIPNKPYAIEIERNSAASCKETVEALGEIGDRPFIIYQGIFQNEEYVSAVAEALRELDEEILLVMMGSDRRNIVPKIQSIYDSTLFFPHIQSPKHLEITSHALIGIVCYDHTSLNKLYCAPNKIFEYSKFGIPMLGNDIPGLMNTVGSTGAAQCVPFVKDALLSAIKEIMENYEAYSENARRFYDQTDNARTIQDLLSEIEERLQDGSGL